MNKKIFAIFILASLVFISGCTEVQEDEQEEVEAGISYTEIQIGDIPTEDFTHVYVTFSEVKLHSNDTGWINIPLNTTTVDLIYLHINNLNETLGIGELETGNYTKLWFVVDNATGVLKSTNETIIFDVPSNTLKIQHLFDLREGNNTISVDIDVNSSIRSIAHGKSYKLLPVIGAIRVKYTNGEQVHIRDKNKIKDITENLPPAIDIEANGSRGKPISAVVDQNITFNASETFDIEGNNLTFTWDFDDGNTANGSVVTHSYSEKGNYWVTLTVDDGDLTSTEQIHITVKQK